MAATRSAARVRATRWACSTIRRSSSAARPGIGGVHGLLIRGLGADRCCVQRAELLLGVGERGLGVEQVIVRAVPVCPARTASGSGMAASSRSAASSGVPAVARRARGH